MLPRRLTPIERPAADAQPTIANMASVYMTDKAVVIKPLKLT